MGPKTDSAAEPVVARDATYHRAPEALRERVRAGLKQEAGPMASEAPWRMAAAFVLVALVSWNAALFVAQPQGEDFLERELVTAHVRSLMVEGHLNDVVSSDQHTVKPWFTGKLDFAPPVQDLANIGFTLTGGRLDYVDGRAVAVLTYRYRQHAVNVFVWPQSGEAKASATTRQGYSIVQWTHAGMRFSAVSDAAAPQLMPLADAL